jgi:hypothetical protein
MTSPLVRVFFLGRAVAEVLSESAEKALTEVLSELGKFDAEQRMNIQSFVDQVNRRANIAMENNVGNSNGSSASPTGAYGGYGGGAGFDRDLQATIDDLRAEIAEVRTELQRYRAGMN